MTARWRHLVINPYFLAGDYRYNLNQQLVDVVRWLSTAPKIGKCFYVFWQLCSKPVCWQLHLKFFKTIFTRVLQNKLQVSSLLTVSCAPKKFLKYFLIVSPKFTFFKKSIWRQKFKCIQNLFFPGFYSNFSVNIVDSPRKIVKSTCHSKMESTNTDTFTEVIN